MSDDAQAWVWEHSRTKNTARLVLLALAVAAGGNATVRMGTAELMRLTNAAKGAVLDGIGRAVALGELEIREPGAGKRAALYALPRAVGYSPVSGREIEPLATSSGREIEPLEPVAVGKLNRKAPDAPLRSGNRTTRHMPSGRETGPLQPELTDDDDRATRAQASSKDIRMYEGGSERERPAVIEGGIPEWARPLVDTLTASRVVVRWDLGEGEWFTLHAMIQRSGVDLLAAAAVRAAARADISHARYLLRAWRNLPPAPAAGTTPVVPQPQYAGPNVVPFDATARRPSKVQAAAAMFAAAAGLNPQEGTP